MTTLSAKADSFSDQSRVALEIRWPRPGQESACEDISRGVLVSVQGQPAVLTSVPSLCQRLGHNDATPGTLLGCPARIHNHDFRAGSFGLATVKHWMTSSSRRWRKQEARESPCNTQAEGCKEHTVSLVPCQSRDRDPLANVDHRAPASGFGKLRIGRSAERPKRCSHQGEARKPTLSFGRASCRAVLDRPTTGTLSAFVGILGPRGSARSGVRSFLLCAHYDRLGFEHSCKPCSSCLSRHRDDEQPESYATALSHHSFGRSWSFCSPMCLYHDAQFASLVGAGVEAELEGSAHAQPALRFSSTIRRTSSVTGMPRRAASLRSHAAAGFEKLNRCFSTHEAYHVDMRCQPRGKGDGLPLPAKAGSPRPVN